MTQRVNKILDAIRSTKALDAVPNGSVFFARQLELIEQRIYRVEYPQYKARLIMPVNNEGGDWVKTITYRIYDRVGMAKVIGSYQNDDIPMTDIVADEVTSPVRDIATFFKYSVKDIAYAQHTGLALDAELALASRDSVEQRINQIAFAGDSEYNLQGLLTQPNIPTANVVNGASGFPEWTKKTPNEILFDVLDLFADTIATTNEVERPDTLLLPVYQKELLLQPRSELSDSTILKFLIDNIPYLSSVEDIIGVPQLKGAGTGGKDIMIALTRDERKLELSLPLDVIVMLPELKSMSYETIVRAATGGTIVRYPLSARVAEGI